MSWENMTKREIKRIQEKDCKYCKNSIKISSADSGCDYLAIHKKRRPGKPGECRAAGIFEKRERRGRQRKTTVAGML